ncbi:MAG: 4-hydroxy-tetrahydrodipicolinate synthase [Flavobacteriaceae bacterium]|tara:strand:+ start:1949 stop:2839 length:891 start_codon:yes stop_codon:yes gene_type:complete
MNAFSGTAVALVTPFSPDNLVDVLALKQLVRRNINAGINYLVVLGTTAETATLSLEDQQLVIKTVVEENQGEVPLVLGLGGNDTDALVTQIKQTNFEHFAAILSVTPYYNRPTQEGLIAHFNAVAKACPIPVIIYNVPLRTGVNMWAKTSIAIAQNNTNIIGIKEACGDMEQVAELLSTKPEGFLVISGDDATAFQTTLAGGAGVISVIGQAIPEILVKLINSALNGHDVKMNCLNENLQPLINVVFEEGNPAGIKGLLSLISDFPLGVRLPLLPASSVLVSKLKSELNILNPINC